MKHNRQLGYGYGLTMPHDYVTATTMSIVPRKISQPHICKRPSSWAEARPRVSGARMNAVVHNRLQTAWTCMAIARINIFCTSAHSFRIVVCNRMHNKSVTVLYKQSIHFRWTHDSNASRFHSFSHVSAFSRFICALLCFAGIQTGR